MKRRDVLKLSAASLFAAVGPGCASTSKIPPLLANAQKTQAWNTVLTASPGDFDHQVHKSAIDGVIPMALRNKRYLLNGPGRVAYNRYVAHPFDGHGYLRDFSFDDDGGVSLRARFVRTPSFVVEEKHQQVVVPGLGTLPEPGAPEVNVQVRNVANTTVVPYAGKWLAGWEGGLPYALDPATMRTTGAERFGDVLPGEGATLAHMRIDPVSGRLVTLSPTLGMKTGLVFNEFNADGQVVSTTTTEYDGMAFIHDFVVTPSHYILSKNPMTADLVAFAKAQMGVDVLLKALAADREQPGGLVVIPRSGQKGAPLTVVNFDVPAYVVHFGNAFEVGQGDGRHDLVVDMCAMPDVVFGNEFGYRGPRAELDPGLPDERQPQQVLRVSIPVDGARVATSASPKRIATHAMDFPRVALDQEGQNAPFLIAATSADTRRSDPFDSVAYVDLQDLERDETVWTPGQHRFVGEPVLFPADDAKSKGFVVAMVYDGLKASSTLVVLDAGAIDKGPIASATFPLLPYGFHGWPVV